MGTSTQTDGGMITPLIKSLPRWMLFLSHVENLQFYHALDTNLRQQRTKVLKDYFYWSTMRNDKK